jgi:hypothetical protein
MRRNLSFSGADGAPPAIEAKADTTPGVWGSPFAGVGIQTEV